MKRGNIFIIRHGSTKLNSEDRIRGWMDLPLDDQGRKEAKEMGKKLRSCDLDGLIASDLKRTQETAEIVSKETGVPIVGVTHDFRPWNVGNHTGQSNAEVMPILEGYVKNTPTKKVSGGESFNSFKTRFLTALQFVKKEFPGKRIGIVTHHRGDRIMAAWEKKGEPKSREIDIPTFLQKGIPPGDYREEGTKLTFPKEKP